MVMNDELCEWCGTAVATTERLLQPICEHCRNNEELEEMMMAEYDMDVVMSQFWDAIESDQ